MKQRMKRKEISHPAQSKEVEVDRSIDFRKKKLHHNCFCFLSPFCDMIICINQS